MASISDVETAIQSLIEATVYPNGSPPSALGYPVKIYAGWPDPATLDADMVEAAKDGRPTAAHLSIYPLPSGRNVTRYQGQRLTKRIETPTYGVALLGQVVTITGSPPGTYFPHNIAVVVDGFPYMVQATPGQTAAEVAAALLSAIGADFPAATRTGAQITLPDDARLGAPVIGVTGQTIREVKRQEREVQIAVWTSSPAGRSALADLLDPALSDTPFLTLADGSQCRFHCKAEREDDFQQKQRIYRRLWIYTVEYAVTVVEGATQIIAPMVAAETFVQQALFAAPAEPGAESSGGFDGSLDWSNPDDLILHPAL